MSMDYVRRTYGVPAKRGGRVRVRFEKKYGTITSATQYVHVRLDGRKKPDRFHPLALEYFEEGTK